MDREKYDHIVGQFEETFKSRDYLIDHNSYDYYFNGDGKRDKRKKYFNIHIVLKSLRRFDTVENTKTMGDVFTNAANIMKAAEEKYDDVVFNSCTYDDNGIVRIRFCSVIEVALRELTSGTTFYKEGW